MRNRGRLIGLLAGVVVAALAIVALTYALHARSQARNASSLDLESHVSVVCPGPTRNVSVQGVPGIQPRNNCTPSFTEQDVRDYLAQGMSLGKIDIVGQPTVARVVFLSVRDLGQQTGDRGWLSEYPRGRFQTERRRVRVLLSAVCFRIQEAFLGTCPLC